jgi:uncharacterized protein
MNIEQNKQLASDFFACLSAGDIPGALNLMTDDATWWIVGRPEQLPAAAQTRSTGHKTGSIINGG